MAHSYLLIPKATYLNYQLTNALKTRLKLPLVDEEDNPTVITVREGLNSTPYKSGKHIPVILTESVGITKARPASTATHALCPVNNISNNTRAVFAADTSFSGVDYNKFELTPREVIRLRKTGVFATNL